MDLLPSNPQNLQSSTAQLILFTILTQFPHPYQLPQLQITSTIQQLIILSQRLNDLAFLLFHISTLHQRVETLQSGIYRWRFPFTLIKHDQMYEIGGKRTQ